MSMYQSIGTAAATDRVMEALVAGLETEFGHGAGKALAQRFLEAEEADFRWDARVDERWIGASESPDDEDLELDRIAICGRLDGRWFCATMLVDGDGEAHGMTRCREFRSFVGHECDASCALIAAASERRGGVGGRSPLPHF